jgi:elongation factor P
MAHMLSHTDLRKGTKVEIDGQPYLIVESDFVKPGKGQAFTRARVKNYLTGRVIERTVKSNESLPKADVEGKTCQYMYADGEHFHFMDGATYDQFQFDAEALGDSVNWLVPNAEYNVMFWSGRPISVEAPNFVELEITECEPGVRGDTATGTMKPATMSTGAIVHVPLFVNQNDWIRIDTRTGTYVERVKAPT